MAGYFVNFCKNYKNVDDWPANIGQQASGLVWHWLQRMEKRKPVVMSRGARKRWKLAKNMFMVLRRIKEEVGIIP